MSGWQFHLEEVMRRFVRDNALSLTMFGFFLVFWAAQSISGWHAANADNHEHHQPAESYPNYLTTGHFVEATAENWESEFLQMSGYVFLTAFLRQRGSPESKPFEDDETDEDPRQAPDREDVPWPVRRGGLVLDVYEHSFALVLFAIFLACFAVHAAGGAAEFNQEQLAHGEPAVSVGQFLTTSQFWFQSFQNWQSEFFVVGAVALLGIRLRERGSPESKPVAAPHSQTGSS
jgi:hypothetical protein